MRTINNMMVKYGIGVSFPINTGIAFTVSSPVPTKSYYTGDPAVHFHDKRKTQMYMWVVDI